MTHAKEATELVAEFQRYKSESLPGTDLADKKDNLSTGENNNADSLPSERSKDNKDDRDIDNNRAVDKVETEDLSSLKEQIAATKREQEVKSRENENLKARIAASEREKSDIARKLAEESVRREQVEDNSLESQINGLNSEAENLKSQMNALFQAGKFAEYHDLSAQLVEVIASKKMLSNQKLERDQQKVNRPAVNQNTQQSDPLAAYPPKTQEWIKNHPQFLQDAYYNKLALEGHAGAVYNKVPLESPEYFRFVEDHIDRQLNPRVKEAEREAVKQQSQQSKDADYSTSAPPSRGNDINVATGKRQQSKPQLTPEMESYALSMFPKLSPADAIKKYGDLRQELINENRISA